MNANFPSLEEVEAFFCNQLECWDETRERFNGLKTVETKGLRIGDTVINAQFNPSRMISTGAKIDKASIAKRPCFLCAKNRPAVQTMLPAFNGEFQVLINPFPIITGHLVIAATEHTEQRLQNHYRQFAEIAEAMPGYLVLYNGPKCGASAPDHLHFQAGKRGTIPIERDWANYYATKLQPLNFAQGLYLVNDFACPAIAIVAENIDNSTRIFESLYKKLQTHSSDEEFPVNVLAWKDNGKIITVVILRSKHRPDCYFLEGEKQMLISPGSVDMGGLLITPRKKDFETLTPDKGFSILREVTLNEEQIIDLLK